MFIAFFGIFVYGLLAALPGSVLPTLERNRYLPNDSAVDTFLLINAIGAVLAYLVSGPIIDRLGKKFALLFGAALVIVSMGGFALALGLGANAIVASGHALVVDVAVTWRNAALNLLDICFGLGRVMGIGFAGLLVIPPAVGYVSSAVGGDAGNLRAGLVAIMS
jgi:MFS family permease